MDSTKQAQIQAHVKALAALLYEETPSEEVQTLEGIERSVRSHLLKHVGPDMAIFLSKAAAAQAADEKGDSVVLSDD